MNEEDGGRKEESGGSEREGGGGKEKKLESRGRPDVLIFLRDRAQPCPGTQWDIQCFASEEMRGNWTR